jgi:hypothetical protein
MHFADVVTLAFFSRLLTIKEKRDFRRTCGNTRLSSGSARGIAPPTFTLASPVRVRAMRG